MYRMNEELKPVERQECAVCGHIKKLVWVQHEGQTKVAIKCKCGFALYRPPAKRDKLTHVLDIIRELEKEFNAPVMKWEIIERAVKEDIQLQEIENAIERLKIDGQIYDPNRNDRYKVV